jgi:hypothetical protein
MTRASRTRADLFHVQVLADACAVKAGWIRIRTLAHLEDAMKLYTALNDTKIVHVRIMRGTRKVIGP